MVGNRRSQNSAPRCRASSHMCGRPVSIIRRVIALATTSRGARSASSCTPCMNRSPSKSTRKAPSPRTASEIRGCWPRESGPRYITVGWNCTNSRSRSTARRAARAPCRRRWRRRGWWSARTPGRARRWRARRPGSARRPTPSRWPSPITCRVTPATPPSLGAGAGRRPGRARSTSISGAALDRGDQGPLDLGAGRVATGVGDPVAVVAALAGQRQLAVGRRGRSSRPARSARAPPRGPR